MAKLILKCRYLKAGSAPHSENLIKYIAKRDGVEKIDDSWKAEPATKAQTKLIRQLVEDFPEAVDSFEYQDYVSAPTKGTASELITRTLEENADLIGKRENYVEYIAKRPRVERMGAHGLFTDADTPIHLSAVAREVAQHDGIVWTDVLSLRREDAARLGYDNAVAWRDLLRSHASTLAESMKIPLADLRWYAAFHNEAHHPHVHIVAYSAGKEPYMTEQAILKMKSAFARDIFKQDNVQVYDRMTTHRNALVDTSRDAIAEIVEQINTGRYENEAVELMLRKLAESLSHTKGKKVYGYLPKTAKNLVNGIVDELSKDERISRLYELWYEQREEVIRTYQDTMPERVPLSQNKTFRSIRNAVVQEALNILDDRITFEDALNETDEPVPDILDEPAEPLRPTNSWNDPADMHYQYRKAKEYLNKDSEQYDPVEAVRWLKLSASQGYDIAMYRLGKMFLCGDEIEQDVGYGLRWLWQAEAKDNQYAQYLLGKTYLKGDVVYADFSMAERLFEKASVQGSSYAKYSLAKMHLDGLAEHSNTEKALYLLKESADLGNQWAEYLLGKILMRGELCEKNMAEAERLLKASAYQKNSQAQYLLGKLYLSEDGIPKDMQEALRWLWESAEQENQYAQYQLGKMYLYGQGVQKDYALAVQLLTASAEQGNAYATRLLENYRPFSTGASSALASLRLLARLSQILRDNMKKDDNNRNYIEKKLRQRIEEKKMAHGLKMG